MTNREILQIAMEQSAIDSHCQVDDFLSEKSTVVISEPNPKARKYLELPFFCDLTFYGNQIVASVAPEIREEVETYLAKFPPEHCFETPNMHVLEQILQKYGHKVCFMAEYFLPDMNLLRPLPCNYELRVLFPEDFAGCYLPQWSNALCEKRKHLDVLAVGAFDGEKLVGLGGCSADCDTMWQIGVDVLPEYRQQGIASAITSRLALEIVERGKVPFYCCAWSNLRSARNAVKSGFRPAWVQLTAKAKEQVEVMNQ